MNDQAINIKMEKIKRTSNEDGDQTGICIFAIPINFIEG
jgi:hypothetical protein